MSSNTFTVTISPVKLNALPEYDAVIAAGQKILVETSNWKKGKTYNGVETFSRPKGALDGAPWHCRVSQHSTEEVTFDQLWNKLGKNKAVNEKEFVPDITKVTEITKIDDFQSVWSMLYTFTPPVAPRVFTVLQVVFQAESPRSGMVVSIPVDLSGEPQQSLEENGVKGRYASVERILELENGSIEWRMATSSTPGGNIPTFFVERTMAGKIASDVPHLLALIKKEHA